MQWGFIWKTFLFMFRTPISLFFKNLLLPLFSNCTPFIAHLFFFSKLCVKRTTCPILPAYDWRQERCNHKVSPGPLSSGLYPQPNHKSKSTTITMKLIYFFSPFTIYAFVQKQICFWSTYMWIHFCVPPYLYNVTGTEYLNSKQILTQSLHISFFAFVFKT